MRAFRALLAGLLVSVGLGATATTAGAATVSFTVDTITDAPDADPGDGSCATSGGDCSLRAAVDEASAGPVAVAVDLPAGHYVVGAVPLQSAGEITITGAGRSSTTIDAGGDRAFEVADGPFRLAAVTVSGGGSSGGGAVLADGAAVTLDDVRITNNHGAGDGGSIVVSDGSLSIEDSAVDHNSGQNGGAVFAADSRVVLRDSTFSSNQAAQSGGAVFLDHVGPLTIDGVTFAGNDAVGPGGAVAIEGTAGLAPMSAVITDSTFTDNLSTQEGGAIYIGSTSNGRQELGVRITGSHFEGNAGEVGGAVALANGILQIASSTFTGNTASGGGGGAVGAAGDLTITGSAFTDNDATGMGGGVATVGPTSISGTSFTGNHAGTLGGAGAFIGRAAPSLSGVTCADNHADSGNDDVWRSEPALSAGTTGGADGGSGSSGGTDGGGSTGGGSGGSGSSGSTDDGSSSAATDGGGGTGSSSTAPSLDDLTTEGGSGPHGGSNDELANPTPSPGATVPKQVLHDGDEDGGGPLPWVAAALILLGGTALFVVQRARRS